MNISAWVTHRDYIIKLCLLLLFSWCHQSITTGRKWKIFHFFCVEVINTPFALLLDTAVYKLQVYIWEPESRSAGSVSKQLPTSASPRHPRHLSGFTDRLSHSQPHVHDGAQVRKNESKLQYFKIFIWFTFDMFKICLNYPCWSSGWNNLLVFHCKHFFMI